MKTDSDPVKYTARTKASRQRVFYGWYLVFIAAFINFLLGGITYYSFTALVNPAAAIFGWSYAEISLAMTLRGIERSLFSPFIGFLADRFPTRKLALAGVSIIGAGLILIGLSTSLMSFYLASLLIALGATLGVDLVPTTMIMRWFKSNAGKAIGLFSAGIGTGGLLVPFVTWLVDSQGWKNSLIFLGVGVWTVALPLVSLYRSRPEDIGEMPDGNLSKPIMKNGDVIKLEDTALSWKEALRTRSFWCIGLMFMLQLAAFNTAVIHIMPYLISVDISRSIAAVSAMLMPIASIPSRFAFGWLADRYPKNFIVTVSGLLMSAGLASLTFAGKGSLWAVALFVGLFGLGGGGVTTLSSYMIREHFGSRSFGSIYGLLGILFAAGSLTAPPIAGWIYDVRGEYYPIWLIMSGLCTVSISLMLKLPKVRK